MLRSPPVAAHGEFTLERRYEATTSAVYAAWTDPTTRARWFVGPDHWTELAREFDFRTGGSERLHGRFGSGLETLYLAHFHVIEPEWRVVYAYDMHVAGVLHSVSLATLELKSDRGGTRLRHAEQLVFLDGTDPTKGAVSRKHGTGAHFDRLAAIVNPPEAAA
jgi:uncharacterized protein YndB with AHSA1/START domain